MHWTEINTVFHSNYGHHAITLQYQYALQPLGIAAATNFAWYHILRERVPPATGEILTGAKAL